MSLKEQMTADIDIFVNPDEFAVTAVFSRSVESIEVLFDLEPDDNAEMLMPVIRCKKSDAPGIEYGDTFTIAGKVYGVMNFYDESDLLTVVTNEVM